MFAGIFSGIAGGVLKGILDGIFGVLLTWLRETRAEAAQRELGSLTVERDQALAGAKAQQQASDIDAKRDDWGDLLGKLETGEAL